MSAGSAMSGTTSMRPYGALNGSFQVKIACALPCAGRVGITVCDAAMTEPSSAKTVAMSGTLLSGYAV
jgi:hypothetical protein